MARMYALTLLFLFSGPFGLSQISNSGLLMVNSSAGAPTLKSCIVALPEGGGTCTVPPNYSETLSSDLVLRSNVVLQFMGPCRITLGPFSVQVPQGANNVSIVSPFAHSTERSGHPEGCSFVGYTGAGSAVVAGSSAGFTYNVLVRGINVSLSSAQPGAVGFRYVNCVDCPMEHDEVVGGAVSGQVGYRFHGEGGAFSGTSTLIDLECNFSASSSSGRCLQFLGDTNSYPMLGGHANMGGKTNQSVCIDVAGPEASAVDPGGFDCDVAGTAITVESISTTAIRGFIRVDAGVGTLAVFGPRTKGNQITTNGRTALMPVVDDGTPNTNSVMDGFDSQLNSRNFRIVGNAKGFGIIDQVSKTPIFVGIPGKDTRMNASTDSQLDFNWDAGSGERFCNGEKKCNLIIEASGVIHPATPGGLDIGSASAPFSAINLGAPSGKKVRLSAENALIVIASGRLSIDAQQIGAGSCGTLSTGQARGTDAGDLILWNYSERPKDTQLQPTPFASEDQVHFVLCNPTGEPLSSRPMVLNWKAVR